LYFIQPLYSKTCRSFTFPSAAGSMWCTVGYFYIHAIRNVLTTTVAVAAAASTPLSFLFPPGFRGPLTHRHPRSRRCTTVLDTPSSAPSFTFRTTVPDASPPSPSPLPLVFSFVAHDSKNFTGSLSLDVHPADFISSYILHLLLTLSYRAPHSSLPRLRPHDTPSTVSSLRSFVTTQRAHLIRIIRAISVFPTRPPRFFVVAPSRARVLSKVGSRRRLQNEISKDNIFLKTMNEKFNDVFFVSAFCCDNIVRNS